MAPLWIGDDPERTESAGHVDHDRVLGLLQQRKGRLCDTDDTDRIGIENREGDWATDVRRRSDPGIVDEHVEVALAFCDDTQSGLHRRVVSHIELRELATQLGCRRPCALDTARPDIDGVPLTDQLTGQSRSRVPCWSRR